MCIIYKNTFRPFGMLRILSMREIVIVFIRHCIVGTLKRPRPRHIRTEDLKTIGQKDGRKCKEDNTYEATQNTEDTGEFRTMENQEYGACCFLVTTRQSIQQKIVYISEEL